MYMYIMSKLVNISDSTYAALKQMKQERESFSEVIKRLIVKSKKRPLLDFLGSWPGSEEELDKINLKLIEDRKSLKTREVRF